MRMDIWDDINKEDLVTLIPDLNSKWCVELGMFAYDAEDGINEFIFKED